MRGDPPGERSLIWAELAAHVERRSLKAPARPANLERLFAVLDDDTAEAADLVEIAASDPVLSATILRVANSAGLGGQRAVSDLTEAVVRLGSRAFGMLAIAVTVRSAFSSSPLVREALATTWDRSLATAVWARALAPAAGVSPSLAFLAGLLRHLGALVVLHAVGELADEPVPPEELGWLVKTFEPASSSRLASDWSLPDALAAVLPGAPVTSAPPTLQLVELVLQAEQFASGEPRREVSERVVARVAVDLERLGR